MLLFINPFNNIFKKRYKDSIHLFFVTLIRSTTRYNGISQQSVKEVLKVDSNGYRTYVDIMTSLIGQFVQRIGGEGIG